MSYCPDCGVEIGDSKVCPLCGAMNPRAAGEAAECRDDGSGRKAKFLEGAGLGEDFTPRERRTVVWEVVSVAGFIAAVSLAAINVLVERRFSWSAYPIASILFVWVLATAFTFFEKKPFLRYLVAGLDTPVFLLVLGFFTGDHDWAFRLGIPLAAWTEFVISLVALAIRASKRKSLDVFAFVFIGAGLQCIGTEILVDLFARGSVSLGWSAICALALVPIAGFLLYLHFRVAKSTNLHRLFRL